jgi:hypothetical protein
MVFIGMCAKRSETAAYGASMLALVSSLLLTLVISPRRPARSIWSKGAAVFFFLLDSKYMRILLEYYNRPAIESTDECLDSWPE